VRCSLRGEGEVCRLDSSASRLCFRLAKDAKVAIITSRMGSIADNTSGGRYGYRMSKVGPTTGTVRLTGVGVHCRLL
jgi:hypothetical protein